MPRPRRRWPESFGCCAAPLSWCGVAIDTDTAGFHRQLLALGIDLAADEARNLLPDAIPIDGPAPVGAGPTALLRSAEELLERVATGEAATGLNGLCDRSRDGDFRLRPRSNPTRQERTTIMEPLMAAAADPTDMLRAGRSGGYRLTAAMQRESIKIGRSQRASLASIRHVAAQSAAVDGLTRGHSHPASRQHRGRRRRRAMCSRH